MNNFLIAVNAILPLTSYMLIGIGAKKMGFADEQTFSKMNKFVFKLFFPVMMFSNVYKTDFATTMNVKLVLFAAIFTFASLALLMVIIPKLVADNPSRASIVQACFRGNIAVFGVPLAVAVFGNDNIGPVTIIVAVTVVLYNILSIMILEYFQKKGQKTDPKQICKTILTNPLIVGVYTGLIFNLSGLTAPGAMQKIVSEIASAASVMSLVILGGSLKFSSIGQNKKALVGGCLYKLILQPAIMLPLGIVFGFRGPELFSILVAFGAPVAVSSYVMAFNMGANHELSAQYIAFSTIASVFTVFGWIFLLLTIGVI